MSNINQLILEDIASLKPYVSINKEIRSSNTSYKNAIKAHNAGDSAGFINHMIQHRNHEIEAHKQIAALQGGKHVSARAQFSANHWPALSMRSLGY